MYGSRSLGLALLALVAAGGAAAPRSASADVPDPGRSRIRWSDPRTVCGFFFTPAQTADYLTVFVTLRDAFDLAIPDCSTSVYVAPTAMTPAFCSCCPLPFGAVSDSMGVVGPFVIGSSIGGRGDLDLAITAHCVGDIALASRTVQFTSPDLAGACTPPDIFSLGIWAGGLPPGYDVSSDYTCDGFVDVYDLAFFASGLGLSCGCP